METLIGADEIVIFDTSLPSPFHGLIGSVKRSRAED